MAPAFHIDALEHHTPRILSAYRQFLTHQLQCCHMDGQILFPTTAYDTPLPLQLTPDKPNTARAVLPIWHNMTEVATMYVIAFQPGDGTGEKNVNGASVTGSDDYFLAGMHDAGRITPRKKSCAFEVCLPLFSMSDQKLLPYAVSLDEVTMDPSGKLVHEFDIGLDATLFRMFMDPMSKQEFSPCAYLTCGHERSNVRFGDPHAIYSNPNRLPATQVVGFIAIDEPQHPLAEYFNRFAIMPERTQRS